MFDYLPYDKRQPDYQYTDLLVRLCHEGIPIMTQQEEEAKMVMGHQMRFDLRNGFPLITQRDLSGSYLKQGIGEIIGFINGARTLKQLEGFGCRWWGRWATKEKCEKRRLEVGDLGPGSYGAAFHDFPTLEGGHFNQIQHLVEQIKEMPQLATHFISPWIPQYIGRDQGKTQKVVVAPCHGWYHAMVVDGEIRAHHFQRSADTPVGLVYNFVHYALLTMMLAQVTGYKARELVYTTSYTHMFARQYTPKEIGQPDAVLTLIQRDPRPFPTVTLDPSITNIFDFRTEHVKVEDYHPHPAMSIGTPV
jgi:thymidylate synthase